MEMVNECLLCLENHDELFYCLETRCKKGICRSCILKLVKIKCPFCKNNYNFDKCDNCYQIIMGKNSIKIEGDTFCERCLVNCRDCRKLTYEHKITPRGEITRNQEGAG